MKKYTLEIEYNEDDDTIEYIKEQVGGKFEEVVLPDDKAMLNKAVFPLADTDFSAYIEIMDVGIDSAFVIGNA